MLLTAVPLWSAAAELEIGRRIYEDGVLSSGAPVVGMRKGGAPLSGKVAACANCHRRSGMGGAEGDLRIPPITGKHLFDAGTGKRGKAARAPYTDATLAHAIGRAETGTGAAMSVMMPRYALDESEMGGLIAYLKQLSSQLSPGVGVDVVRFATVIAPGVEPDRRQALADTMRSVVAQENAAIRLGRRYVTADGAMPLGSGRRWTLDVWELQGPPDTWGAQLDAWYRRQPVFALVSGVSNGTWEPVHDFCERERVPCWFPSVALPPAPDKAFYPVYFSRGVLLEADVLAKHLRTTSERRPKRVVQVFGDDAVGRGAAHALRQALAGSGIAVEDRLLGTAPDAMKRAVADVNGEDALMFWLRRTELAGLDRLWPKHQTVAYFSSVLGGGERMPLSAAWKGKAQLVYPYDLPETRRANLAKFHEWLRLRGLPLVDEVLQAEAYFALNFLTDTLAEMGDDLYRDYLLECAETMIGRRDVGKVEQDARGRAQFGRGGPGAQAKRPPIVGIDAYAASMPRPVKVAGDRSTVYPRLALGPNQRFASKGGYIVRFADLESDKLVPESGWIVP